MLADLTWEGGKIMECTSSTNPVPGPIPHITISQKADLHTTIFLAGIWDTENSQSSLNSSILTLHCLGDKLGTFSLMDWLTLSLFGEEIVF